jgi:hypothetical protein
MIIRHFQVRIDIDKDLEDSLRRLTLQEDGEDVRKLDPWENLAETFVPILMGQLHVVVERPSTGQFELYGDFRRSMSSSFLLLIYVLPNSS